jgi:hypothetical protein
MGNGLEIEVVSESAIELRTEGVQGPPGPPGPPGGAFFVHVQNSPSATWIINHNLGRRPGVSLLTLNGDEFEGQIRHVSSNQAQALLATAMAGQALCI